jgi:hypothetical protein
LKSGSLKELSLKYEKNNLSGVVIVSDISEVGELEEDIPYNGYGGSLLLHRTYVT